MSDLGEVLRAARGRLGIDQSELGRRVGVGQQAVSRWESGGSRPRRPLAEKLANALNLRLADILEAAGYSSTPSAETMAIPVRPMLRTLPFHELSAERFEDACAEVLGYLHPEGHASRFGGTGEKQDGIDLLVDGELSVKGQCKRHRQFGPKQVRDAIAAVDVPAAINYLFLSRTTASAAARKEIAKVPAWQLWDGEDLSRWVRSNLFVNSPESAIRFVETYFPNHRESFLGVPEPSSWQTPDQFFATFTGTSGFNHDWALVGRSSELASLRDEIGSGVVPVSVLVGRGGIGKTRLIREVAAALEADHWQVRILPAGAVPTAHDYELLPASGNFLIVIDDAHDRNDCANVVARICDRNDSAKVLIATRPYGRPELAAQFARISMRLSDLHTVELGDLTQSAAVELAQQALGPDNEILAERLASISRDCPLVTTVGGFLIRIRSLDPMLLEQDEDIRSEVLLKFKDILVRTSGVADPEARSEVLSCIAALQPFRIGNDGFRVALESLIGRPFDRLLPHLVALEESGALLRRGDSLRIVPDLLGDVILVDAAIDRGSGTDSGFLKRVYEATTGDALTNAFVNTARVDWQIDRRIVRLSARFWDALLAEISSYASVAAYSQLLSVLKRVAQYQPSRTIKAVNEILRHPVESDEPSVSDGWHWHTTWSDVLVAIPDVLKPTAYSLDHIRDACEILWKLAQSDRRATHQHPSHPLRVLQELAGYDVSKPVAFNRTMLDMAVSWSEGTPSISPLSPIKAIVETEGHSTTFRDHALHFHPFSLNQDVVRPIRQSAMDLAFRELCHPDTWRGIAAAKFIGSAIRYPQGAFGRQVSLDERHSWDDNFVATVDGVAQAMSSADLDPAVVVALMEALHWHADYGAGVVHDAAEAALLLLPTSLSFEVALMVHDGWGHLLRERDMTFGEHQQVTAEMLTRISRRVLDECNDGQAVDLVLERLAVERSDPDRDSTGANRLISEMAQQRPSILPEIATRAVASDDPSLISLIPTMIDMSGRLQPERLIHSYRRLAEADHVAVRVSAACGLATRTRHDHPLAPDELEILHRLARHDDPSVRLAVVHAAASLASSDLASASSLLCNVPFADSSVVSHRVLSYLTWESGELTWSALTPEVKESILVEVSRMVSFDGHEIEEFLRHRSAEDPRRILRMLQGRIELAEREDAPLGYQPVPILWNDSLDLRRDPAFLEYLTEVLSWIGSGEAWQRRHMGKELFAAAAGSFDDTVLSLLLKLVQTGTSEDCATIAEVLSAAAPSMVFDQIDMVSELLDAAARLGSQSLQRMRSGLWASAVTGTRSGTVGEPFAEDVRIRDEGAAIASRLSPGSHAEAFYRDLSESGARTIEQQRDRDVVDFREW
ncbi:helix-turn-helix domain-containing protein [Citricoccus muralis]|uniref:Helix-turn-helix domain-containing protein n=1 Tax=Citricoccus muralis TaxID=169134 RepID=A0ABY8H4W3_9MICC|nr:helix-turn-helix domain-containing protein [Citricoccus muralis]WFP16174.1 helix-turn-helix domain-containing protein [Citricoccus muralis]